MLTSLDSYILTDAVEIIHLTKRNRHRHSGTKFYNLLREGLPDVTGKILVHIYYHLPLSNMAYGTSMFRYFVFKLEQKNHEYIIWWKRKAPCDVSHVYHEPYSKIGWVMFKLKAIARKQFSFLRSSIRWLGIAALLFCTKISMRM